MVTVIDDFEDGDVAEWTTTNFEASTNRAYASSYSGLATYNSATNDDRFGDDPQAYHPISQSVSSGTITVSWYWNESDNGNGHSFGLENSNGTPICALGSDNPQWIVFDGSWSTVSSNGENYNNWVYAEVTVDFSDNTFDYKIEGQSNNNTEIGSLNFANDVSAERVALRLHTGGGGRQAYTGDNTDNNNIEVWIDDIVADGIVSAPSQPQNVTVNQI